MVPFRADLGGQVSFGVYATEQEDAEFRGDEHASFWSRLGKAIKVPETENSFLQLTLKEPIFPHWATYLLKKVTKYAP